MNRPVSILDRRNRVTSFFLFWVALATLTAGQSEALWGQESAADSPDIQVIIGFDGVWKLGHVCPLQIVLPPSMVPQVRAIEVRTEDGEGVSVTYRQELAESRAGDAFRVSVRIGRLDSQLDVSVFGEENRRLAQTQLKPAGGLASDQPLIVAIGSTMGVEELNRTTAEGTDAVFSTALVDAPEKLPANWRDLSGCDLLIMSTADVDFLNGIEMEQWAAIDTWIRRGGGCIVSISGTQELVDAVSHLDRLKQLLPANLLGVGQIDDPGVLESLVATDEHPLGNFSATLLDRPVGNVELSFTDRLARDVPWWISYAHGHGTVRAIASDLGSSSFEAWEDRKLVWQLLLSDYLDNERLKGTRSELRTETASYLGYSDLVGQLRATLDVFPAVKGVSFGQIAAMLVGILLLVGPLDYFISVKWLRRPDFSWYFSGGLLVAMSAGLTIWYGSLRPDEIRVNSAQVVDLDTMNGRVSGQLWSHVYSGRAHQLDVTAEHRQDVFAADQQALVPMDVDWQGLPGNGLGGLSSQLQMDRGFPPYVISRSANGHATVLSVGVPAAGTKCFNATWESQLDLKQLSSLQELKGVDQLSGELVNPLDVPLYEPKLFYHSWYYGLDSQLAAGARVSISADTIPKDLARRLNARKNVDGKDSITRWDPADRDSLDRLLELMMFHKAAAGRAYTSLAHRYQPHMDHSNLLATNRAILVGRLEASPASLSVNCPSSPDLEVVSDIDRVWCRISIPVATSSSAQSP